MLNTAKVCAAAASGRPLRAPTHVVAYSGAKPRGNRQVEMVKDAVPYVVSGVGVLCGVNPRAKELVGRAVATTAVTAWALYSAACILTCGATTAGKAYDIITGKNSSRTDFTQSDAFIQEEGGVFANQ